ncbi:MAG: hypothetical protein Q8R91_04715 [Candidatus Omnitrophota bacterium]|nr:hypothetical protein [Candidatus Omnitrophota bacterium]
MEKSNKTNLALILTGVGGNGLMWLADISGYTPPSWLLIPGIGICSLMFIVGVVFQLRSIVSKWKKCKQTHPVQEPEKPPQNTANMSEQNPFIPLHEAAIALYSETRSPNNLYTCAAEYVAPFPNESYEDSVRTYMSFVVLADGGPVFARRPPSTQSEQLDQEIVENAKSSLWFDNDKVAHFTCTLADKSGTFSHIAVQQKSIAQLIERTKERAQHVPRPIHQS